MKKKIIAIMLTLTMCVGLSACGSTSDANSANDRDETVTERRENTSDESDDHTESDIQVADAQEEPEEEESIAEEERTPNGYINDEGYYVFGWYEQDNDESNGPEPIEWVILDENENGILLLSRYVLDDANYNDTKEEVTWETCSLREWLNNDFYNTAFDDEMKSHINTVTLDNEDNQHYGSQGGNETSDKIFCLSVSEILEYYDFNSWYTESNPYHYQNERSKDEYDYGFCEDLIAQARAYGFHRGADNHEITDYNYNEGSIGSEYPLSEQGYSDSCIGKLGANWWLRTPGLSNVCACYVGTYGETGESNSAIVNDILCIGVRPALYISR